MPLATPALLLLALLGLGCDALADPPALSELWEGDASAAERPEGWESLEGEEAATRLYYQFVDSARRVRFVERIEEVPEALRATVGFVKLDVPPPLSPGDAARVRQERLASNSGARVAASGGATRVVLYSAEWCGACRKAKRHLARRGIEYEERDVDQPRHAEELQRKTGARAIPVLDVEGRMLTGFSADSYDALIDRA